MTLLCDAHRIEYAPEKPEWQQEKHRFYVELPGTHTQVVLTDIGQS